MDNETNARDIKGFLLKFMAFASNMKARELNYILHVSVTNLTLMVSVGQKRELFRIPSFREIDFQEIEKALRVGI